MKTILTTVLMLILGASSLFAQAPQIYTTSGAVMNGGNKTNDAVLMFVDDNGNVTVGIINGDEKFAVAFDKGRYTYKGSELPYTVQSNDGKYKLTFAILNGYVFELVANGNKKRFYIPNDNFRVKTEAEGGLKLSMDGNIFIKNHFPLIFGNGGNN
mgnify:FL=1